MAKQFPLKKGGKPAGKPAPVATPKKMTSNPVKDQGGLLAGNPGGKSAVHPDSVVSNMKIPKDLAPRFIGGIQAVMHFVVDPNTHKLFLNALDGPGPAAQKLAEGVENLLKIIVHTSKGSLPPQMYLPVGIYAISWIADYVRRSKLLPLQDSDVAEAMQMFIHTTMMDLKGAQQAGGLIGGAQQGAGQQQPPGGSAPSAGGPRRVTPQQIVQQHLQRMQGGGVPPAAGGGMPPPGPQPGPALPKMQAASVQAPGSNPNLGPGAPPGPLMQPMKPLGT